MSNQLNVECANVIRTWTNSSTKLDNVSDIFTVDYTFGYSKVTVDFLASMRVFLHNPTTKSMFRCSSTDFTRDRVFTFPRLCVSILKEHSRPAQTRLLHLFQDGAFGSNTKCPTRSAFFQAREKVKPECFKKWMHDAVRFFYDNFPKEALVSTWKGMRLWGIDCSVINLLDTPETRRHYSIQTNQFPESETIQGLASFAY
jgi:hypothetical protein